MLTSDWTMLTDFVVHGFLVVHALKESDSTTETFLISRSTLSRVGKIYCLGGDATLTTVHEKVEELLKDARHAGSVELFGTQGFSVDDKTEKHGSIPED